VTWLGRFDQISHRGSQEVIGPLLGEPARAGEDHWHLRVADSKPAEHVGQPRSTARLSPTRSDSRCPRHFGQALHLKSQAAVRNRQVRQNTLITHRVHVGHADSRASLRLSGVAFGADPQPLTVEPRPPPCYGCHRPNARSTAPTHLSSRAPRFRGLLTFPWVVCPGS
jgi:hypothetical protein